MARDTRQREDPRSSRSDGDRSRQKILRAAAALATIEGLEGMSIARLADHIGMSKSGLYAHFGSKEELQLATVETAGEIFAADVIAPAEALPDPIDRLETLCEGFLGHLERRVFPGGCFFVSASTEFDTRPGPVKERLAEFQRDWFERIEGLLVEAQANGKLNPDEDPEQLTFEIEAYMLLANATFVFQNNSAGLGRARVALKARLLVAGARGSSQAIEVTPQ